MSEQNTETTTPPPATGRPNGAWRPNRIVLLAAAALVLAVAVGVFFVFRFADVERERDLQNWQVRMGIVAESRLAAIDDWLAGQFGHLQGLAENTALQLYMTQLGQRVTNSALDILGPSGQLRSGTDDVPVNGRFERSYRYTVVDTIGGGTSEVQKNIIARRGLGLPKNF